MLLNFDLLFSLYIFALNPLIEEGSSQCNFIKVYREKINKMKLIVWILGKREATSKNLI